ncbi:MAG: TIGR02710 family CRISPR-associated protein [Gammaproteobacteria bacterium]|nr:TIGR02710 family CRISPR-associated protein [Gammaproteobacteria bacterium]
MNNVILLCTVGGSHEPVCRAIESVSPGYICFFCTAEDPRSGKPGSDVHVIGKGNVIKAKFGDSAPTLPNIPAQMGYDESRYEPCRVPADDLDGAFLAMRAAVAALAERFPGARFVADYTGGTKTMTAAMVCLALEQDDIDLQLVTGARADLKQVVDGTERAMTASVVRLRLDRAMALYLGGWRRFAYREAAQGLKNIPITVNSPDRAKLELAQALSGALALWDDFDHAGALDSIRPYAGQVAPRYPAMLPMLELLAQQDSSRREPACLLDLWWNAERRAARGRYDDAAARVYRLLEWTAQWQIRRRLEVETANFPAERLPGTVAVRVDADGKIRLGLWHAWQVVKADPGMAGLAQTFIGQQESKLKDLLAIRNESILAHGFQPIAATDWRRMQHWAEKHFLPLLRKLALEADLKELPEQLPTQFSA